MRWRRETFSLALSDIKNQHMILKNGDRQHDGIHKLVLIGGTQNAVQQDFWWSPLLRFSGWFLMFVCLNKIFFFFLNVQTLCCSNIGQLKSRPNAVKTNNNTWSYSLLAYLAAISQLQQPKKVLFERLRVKFPTTANTDHRNGNQNLDYSPAVILFVNIRCLQFW